MKNRVVVTGLGIVSPVGIGKEKFWQALLNGQSGVDKITRFDVSNFTTQIAAEVKDFNPQDYLDKKEAKRMDRFTQFGVAAAKLALEDANLQISEENAEDVGVIVASGIGGIETLEEQHKILLEKGPNRVSPFLIPMMIINMAGGQISISTGAKGPNSTIVTACASSTHAIGDAFKLLQRGDAKVVIAGGTEAPITPLGLAGFCSLKALSSRNNEPQRASRPFDAERDGFVMGEGAGMVILETLDHALARGARIYGEVAGYGLTGDAYHITAPDPGGLGAARGMSMAIRDADLEPIEIDYINAHGTSTDMNDKFETLAIKRVFGDHANKIAISSTKSMTGHLLGAAGAVEFIAATLAVNEDIIPPTINYENPDPDCDLNYTPNQAKKMLVRAAISNSLGFGGHNATILVKKYQG